MHDTRQDDTDIDRHLCIYVENLDHNSLSRNYIIAKHRFFQVTTTYEERDAAMRAWAREIALAGLWERKVYYPPQDIKAVILDVQDQG